jgi:hypothetical protein
VTPYFIAVRLVVRITGLKISDTWNLLRVDPERQGINLRETLFSNAFRIQKPPKLPELGNLTEGDHTYKENALVS